MFKKILFILILPFFLYAQWTDPRPKSIQLWHLNTSFFDSLGNVVRDSVAALASDGVTVLNDGGLKQKVFATLAALQLAAADSVGMIAIVKNIGQFEYADSSKAEDGWNYIDSGTQGKQWQRLKTVTPSLQIDAFGEREYLEYGSPFGTIYSEASAILSPSSGWQDQAVDNAYLFEDTDGSKYVYYEGQSGGTERIGVVSVDANYENPVDGGSNPIVNIGSSGQWDDTHVKIPLVVKSGSTYYLFYMGDPGTGNLQIGLATSSSPTSGFTKHPSNPIITAGTGWEASVGQMAIFKLGELWYLLYRGMTDRTTVSSGNMGVAVSSDLVNWTKVSTNPVIDPGNYGIAGASPLIFQDKLYVTVQTFRTGVTGGLYYPIWQAEIDDSLKIWSEVGSAIDTSDAYESLSNAKQVGRKLIYWMEGISGNDLKVFHKNIYDNFPGSQSLNMEKIQLINRSTNADQAFMLMDANGDFGINAGQAEEIYFGYFGTKRLTIENASGEVGIGTENPSAAFHVNSGTSNTGIKLESTDQDAVMAFLDNATTQGAPPYIGARTNDLLMGIGAAVPYWFDLLDSTMGVGTSSPNRLLHLASASAPTIRMQATSTAASPLINFQLESANAWNLGVNHTSGRFVITTGGNDVNADSVGILNITAAGSDTVTITGNLNVTGIITKDGSNYTNPDYVFEPDYELLSIDSVRSFVTNRKHLPGVPSSADLKIDLFEQNRVLLEKLEEAYLYILQIDNRLKKLEKN